MKTQTLKNINRKLSFAKVAAAVTLAAKVNRTLVRFEMGPAEHRQVFVASPKKPVATLCWEWAKSVPGMMVSSASRKTKQRKAVNSVD